MMLCHNILYSLASQTMIYNPIWLACWGVSNDQRVYVSVAKRMDPAALARVRSVV